MAQPLIIQYTNLLHKHRDPEAEAVKKFVQEHAEDAVFRRRVEALNYVFQLKERVLVPSEASEPPRMLSQ